MPDKNKTRLEIVIDGRKVKSNIFGEYTRCSTSTILKNCRVTSVAHYAALNIITVYAERIRVTK